MCRLRYGWLVLGCLLPALAEPVVLSDCENPAAWKVAGKATVEAAADAAVGQGAVQVGLPGTATFTIAARATAAMADWDRYQGISFRVKGDGSADYGCLAVGGGGSDSTYTYVTYFPLRDTAWHTVTVGWADWVPEGQVNPIGTPGALPPSGITVLRCGSRWTIGHNNYPLEPVSFGLDQVQLEEQVPPPGPVPAFRPLADVAARLRAGEPVNIRCLGDSITAGTSLPNREQQRYAVVAGRLLREWFGTDTIRCESWAVGGAKLADARAWIPRDFEGPAPDLVTVLYGYNDKSNAYTRGSYAAGLNDYLDRIARATGGQSAVLLLTCLPGGGPRWSMLDDFAEVVRETAAQRGLACFDFQQVFKALGREGLEQILADQAHPNAEGHELLAWALAGYLAQQAGLTPPERPARQVVEPGPDHRWTFADGPADWQLDGPDVTWQPAAAAPFDQPTLRYHMTGPAADHRRAWSPRLPVKPGQRYRLSAEVYFEEAGTGRMGLYACWLPDLAAQQPPEIQPVRGAGGLVGTWETVTGEVVVPDTAGALQVLVWSPSDGIGTYRVRSVTVEGVR